MVSPTERFERWRRKQTARTTNLAQRVLDELVPLYEAKGLRRFDDYAGSNLSIVGANTIALQRRSGERWPTVEIQFDRRGRASFSIRFAELPEVCHRWTTGVSVPIDRKQANVVESGGYYLLSKGTRRNWDGMFGVPGFAIFPDRRVALDFELAKERSQFLADMFDTGIPEAWAFAPSGYVSEFVLKVGFPREQAGVRASSP